MDVVRVKGIAMTDSTQFENHSLSGGLTFRSGTLPEKFVWSQAQFEQQWTQHPLERHLVKMIGKLIQVPRWQQAFGATYNYTGSRNNALPIPRSLMPLLDWSQRTIDSRLNGLLLNWYEGSEDYIGPHHDSTTGLVTGSPIVTISFGEQRTFRLTRWEGRKRDDHQDFPASHGNVFVVGWDLNKVWKHEVLKRTAYTGRRISVTLRAFSHGVLPPEQYCEPRSTSS